MRAIIVTCGLLLVLAAVLLARNDGTGDTQQLHRSLPFGVKPVR